MTRRSALILLPTALTVGRLFAVPLTIAWMLEGDYRGAFVVFACAGISDWLDGWLARRLDARTEIGAYLDPIADKILLTSVFILLGHQGLVPEWLVILVVFRDVLIVGGVMLFHTAAIKVTMAPLLISKFNSLVQLLYAGWVLAQLGFGLGAPEIGKTLMVAVTATTAASGIAYIAKWAGRLSVGERKDG